jgi:hypothetical protein
MEIRANNILTEMLRSRVLRWVLLSIVPVPAVGAPIAARPRHTLVPLLGDHAMPKISCLCGETINLSAIPNPLGIKIVSETALEALVTRLVESFQRAHSPGEFEQMAYHVLALSSPGIIQAYECPRCGRLLVFARASDAEPALWYAIERYRDAKVPHLTRLIAEKMKE